MSFGERLQWGPHPRAQPLLEENVPRLYHNINPVADIWEDLQWRRFEPTETELDHQNFLSTYRNLFTPLAKDAIATVFANMREVGPPNCPARELTAIELCFHPRFRDRFLRWVALQVQCDTALIAHFNTPKTAKMMTTLNAQMNWLRDWFAALRQE